jgi:hypothetical protein
MTETTGSPTVMSLEEVIANHLEYNITLSVTKEQADTLVPICIEAIKEVNAYRLHTLIKLPAGQTITWLSTGETTDMCPAYALVYRYQLTDWLKDGWNMVEDKE